MSVHCEKCGQASYLPGLVRGLESELEAKVKECAKLKRNFKNSFEAGESLMKQRDQLRACLKEVVDTLKFYGDENTYYAESNPYGYTYGLVPNHDCEHLKHKGGLKFAGKRARQAIEKANKILEGE